MVTYVDVNADLGEDCGDDFAMLPLISSANIACGGHAGGGQTLTATVAAAVELGVNVGAHPSYADRDNFGRFSHAEELTDRDIAALVAEQILLLSDEAWRHGTVLSHVKAHGALYHDVMSNQRVTDAFLAAVIWVSRQHDSDAEPYPVMGLPGSLLSRTAAQRGVRFLAEGFADRAYLPSGNLVPRSEAGAVLDEVAAVQQAVSLATDRTVLDTSGNLLVMPVDTICVHGDTPGAVQLTQDIVSRFSLSGVWVRGF